MRTPPPAALSRPDLRVVGYRRVLGMPGPVWTMALWYASVSVLLAISLVVPLNANANPALRAGLLAYAVLVLASLLVLRERTPPWYLKVQLGIAILGALALISASQTPEGTVTSSMALIIVATYVGFWLTPRTGLAYVGASSVGLVIALAAAGNIPRLLIPCLLVIVISFGLVLTLSALVQQMDRQLVTDPLTGLLNRTAMFRIADGASGSLRDPAAALVVIDLDEFKSVNDRMGHLAGDRVLQEFGAAMREISRPGDLAIRSGGDEFMMLLPRTDLATAQGIVTRLRTRTPVPWSCGVAEWSGAEPLDAALARADASMYAEKARRDH